MKRYAFSAGLFILSLVLSCCSNDGRSTRSAYVAKFTAADEDYVDFGSFTGFMNGASWSILEMVKIQASATTGWHFFRGKGWEDVEGDVAIQLQNDVDTGQVYCFVRKGGWQVLMMDKNDVPGLEILDDTWYKICLQYDAASSALKLYVNGNLVDTLSPIDPLDDSANANKLFFGGQDVAPGRGVGDLYSEADAVIAHQAWVQRALTPAEISRYDGTFDTSDPDLFFATGITGMGINDASGGGRNGINGNTPEFFLTNL